MFRIESYVTPILLSYVDKYVRDFKPADAQVSLWAGGVVLHNLVLKPDVLQQEVALPFTLVSGRIHELLIQVPWTKIMSEPIVATIDTIECVLSLHPPAPDESTASENPIGKTTVVEAPPGYMQALVRRIVSNITLKVHHLIVKYVEDDIVLSLNVKHLSIDSCGPDWRPSFADIDQEEPVIRRSVLLDNLTLCLDRADSDGKIRYYQEPLLYRCQLNLRVLTRLVSANIRRASSLSIELRSSKLAWGVTSEQMTLLLRLQTEARNRGPKPNSPSMRNTATPMNTSLPQPISSNTAEPTRGGSWSEWAWSWMPQWYDSAAGIGAESMSPTPTPISFTAYLDDVSLIFKVMEIEAGNRRRPRGFLELKALYAAVKGHMCVPTTLNVTVGLRSVVMKSQDKCTCGHVDSTVSEDDPTYYVIKFDGSEDSDEWSWPDDDFDEFRIDKAELAEEEKDPTKESTNKQADDISESETASAQETQPANKTLWDKMNPLVYIEYIHERSPPLPNMNPYDNPPKDFEYSDWLEDCGLDIQLQPIRLRICMGLIHRIDTLKKIWRESTSAADVELTPRVLTVEEMEILTDNLPQRRINIDVKQMELCLYPWDHSLTERPIRPPALLVVDLPRGNIVISSPLYSHRVCSAASQIPEDRGTLWQGAKMHITSTFNSAGVKIISSTGPEAKPCARLDFRLVMHILMNQHYFQVKKNEHVLFSYSLKLHEGNISGSRPRLETAIQVLSSLINKTYSVPLRGSTLARDALKDEDMVALDVTLEDVTLRGYRTKNVNTHVLIVHSAKGTVLQSTGNQVVKQAWIFSAPDIPSGTPFIRGAAQWCPEPSADALEYVGLWSEPIAVAIDPLFVAWLAYKPWPRTVPEQMPSFASKTISSSVYLFKRRVTPPSSSGRGGSRSASAAELVHQKAKSVGTSSDKERKMSKQDPQRVDKMLELHDRLKKTLITMDMGLVVVYVTTTTASAVDCATLRLAIDRHAANSQSVLAIGLGRWSMHSSGFTKNIWHDIKHDGPTFNIGDLGECFPWKINLNDVSCYSLEYNVGAEMKDKYVGGLKSQLKPTYTILPNTILELVSTTVTLSVVSKSVVFKTVVRKQGTKKTSTTAVDKEEGRTKFFTGGGGHFKPTTLKEFIRGPSNRKKGDNKSSTDDVNQLDDSKQEEETSQKFSPGPLVSIGLNIHADTPPLIVRLDQAQVHIVSASVHCLKHIITLLTSIQSTGLRRQGSQAVLGSSRSLNKSFAEQDEEQRTETDPSQENKSDLVPIFQAYPEDDYLHLKKFIWFQWVINRATAVISSESTKLVIEMEDLITTVDVQEHYRQLKMKMASFSVKHYEKKEGGEWNCGILGGRVLEVREPTSSKEDQFLSITITQAQISTLPASWKEELNPKMLDRKENNDSMFEIYAVIAPMEAVLEPSLLGHILTLVYETYSSTNCPMEAVVELKPATLWPYCYLTAGGMRLVICTIDKQKKTDDSIVVEFSRVTLNPHPPNPISRRPITLESSWLPSEGSLEGRQYDILIEDVKIRSTQLAQLVTEEKNEMDLLKKGAGVDNPAHKWSQLDQLATLTPILHPVNLNCVFAPPLFFGETLICGSGLEINLLSDCAVDLSVDQLALIQRNITEFHNTIRKREIDFNERSNTSLDLSEQSMCPYAEILAVKQEQEESDSSDDDMNISEENMKIDGNVAKSLTGDSGVETVASQYTGKSKESDEQTAMKKNVSVAFLDQVVDPRDYAEIFVTMGTIEITLYTAEDDSPEIALLRLPQQKSDFPTDEDTISTDTGTQAELLSRASRSVTEMIRRMDIGKSKILFGDISFKLPRAFKKTGNIPLLHVTLQQPNLYFWKKKLQKNIQVSLFDAWVGLGDVQSLRGWKRALMSTTRGVPDPATDVPPALATMKISMTTPGSHTSLPSTKTRGSLKLDVERPIMFEVCGERLKRILAIASLVKTKMSLHLPKKLDPRVDTPPLMYKLRKLMVHYSIETAIIQTGQVGLSGSEGAVGWDSVSLQAAWSSRPERLNMRALVGALLVGSGPPYEPRHQMMQPLQLGIEVDGQWEAWRRAEGGASFREPTLRVRFDFDRVVIELRPSDLESLSRMESVLKELKKCKLIPEEISEPSSITSTPEETTASVNTPASVNKIHSETVIPPESKGLRLSGSSIDSAESTDHFYKDDLRSGAFKIVSGGQLPMAYQVVLSGNTVSWRYPHPRAITRLVAFPLPGQNEEINCIMEVFNRIMFRWEPYMYFSIPVSEPKELIVYTPPPEALFSTMWRFRVRSPDKSQEKHVYEFRMNRFLPRQDPLTTEGHPDMGPVTTSNVTAEQLSGVLRVDSYFAPRLLSRSRIYFQMTALEIHIHNSLPVLHGNPKSIEGFYVSKPLRQCHRVLTVSLRQLMGHIALGPSSGNLFLLNTNISSWILNCSTGTMAQLVEEFQLQSSLSDHLSNMANSRLRLRTSNVHVSLNIPRLRTLQSLFFDWKTAINLYKLTPMELIDLTCPLDHKGKRDSVLSAIKALEGRVSLWLNNTCVTALRVGQEESDEVVPLEAGSSLAYRWRNPTAPKRIRFALANPTDWHWSSSVAFTAGTYRVRLENADLLGGQHDAPGAGVYLHVNVEETGAYRTMNISGRLVLANMLRFELLYKVRARFVDPDTWRTISSGELAKESVCRSVLCGANTEMMLKIKLSNHQTGWSGDIPLKECPKENVPWLVKVPSEGDVSYLSVWCRVVRARSDGRILATIWPLYVLYSHLPLDTDVLIVTETMHSPLDLSHTHEAKPAPLVQSAPGRGFSTQLMAPGTTSAKHSLSFQYRNIECPVTREAVPLHYGVTDTSVFDKRGPVINIDEVLQDVVKWLKRSGRHAKSEWPYSIVSRHWPGQWHPALLQPRCDVTVRYQAVRAGGGCSLEVHLSPIVLLCNASPIALTLRAHDAAPLCKLEPGNALSPPSAILHKPFFMSVEMGRETFVSGQLEVSAEEPGRYTEPPPGQVSLDRSTDFAIQCNQKVALFTLFYEIKEEINILGITSSFALVNRLDSDILIAAIATPIDEGSEKLHPKAFKVVPPCNKPCDSAIPLCRFWLRNRWRGGDASQLNTFLCIALPMGAYPASPPVPVRLGKVPSRRAIALHDHQKRSIPVVVTQHNHEGRIVVTIAKDPCPQFLVLNRTDDGIAVAQPIRSNDDNSGSTQAVQDCEGVSWCCIVLPESTAHYSTPAYCARHPPSADHYPSVPFLTFALVFSAEELITAEWCPPVAAAEGEHMVQMPGGLTIKMRAQINPHSTLIELLPIDERDISASDIRRRLIGSISSDLSINRIPKFSDVSNLERTGAEAKLLASIQPRSPIEQEEQLSLRDRHIYSATSIVTSQRVSRKSTEPVQPATESTSKEAKLKPEECKGSRPNEDIVVIRDQTVHSEMNMSHHLGTSEACSFILRNNSDLEIERVRCVMDSIVIEMSVTCDTEPLVALHVDRAALLTLSQSTHTKTICSVMGLQVDNLQYESGQFDFAVVATTRAEMIPVDEWPPLYNMYLDREEFYINETLARFVATICHDKWSVADNRFHELTELELKVGPLALYVEDAYITALVDFFRLTVPDPPSSSTSLIAEARLLQRPLRLRLLHIEPIDLTLTLHTAVRIYIALDQSPLHLSSFKLRDVMTSSERLAHALTVHYLSAAILGAGWVVGGLELLGAPGALAARVGGATGGVRGIASAAAAALLRSLSAWAGSLARNLDILAGDEEHARRAAAARRRPPHSFVEGLITGMTNFAINILGAVGGLAHHPLVGVAVGETESGATALRRGLLGAFAKPLSATADLVAYAGQGLLKQTGWDPVPQPRALQDRAETATLTAGWRRDCVRWTFRLADLNLLSGFKVLLNNAHLLLLFTDKYIVVADPESERVVEMIDLRFCSLSAYQGSIIELVVTQRRTARTADARTADEDDEYTVSAAAMARVARYTGTEGSAVAAGGTESRVLSLLPSPGESHSLHAALAAAIHNNADTHFSLL